MAQLAVFNNACLTRDILFRLDDAKDLAHAQCVLKLWRSVAVAAPAWASLLLQRWPSLSQPCLGHNFESGAPGKVYAARANALCYSRLDTLGFFKGDFFKGGPFIFTVDLRTRSRWPTNFQPFQYFESNMGKEIPPLEFHTYNIDPELRSCSRLLTLEIVCTHEDGETWGCKQVINNYMYSPVWIESRVKLLIRKMYLERMRQKEEDKKEKGTFIPAV